MAVAFAGPPELYEQRGKELVWHTSGAEVSFRSFDYPQGHNGTRESRRKRGDVALSV